jgi:hypothetical protein
MRSVNEIRAERRALARAHDARFVEQATARVDLLTANAKDRAARSLAELAANAAADGNPRLALPDDPESTPLLRVALLYLMATPDFEAWLRKNVTELVSGFASDISLAEYEARMSAIDAELVEANRLARQAPLLAQRDELDERLVALEQD